MRTILLAILLLCPGLAWAQPVSDPSGTLTVVPPAGWQSATQDKTLLLVSADQTASIALTARGPIPIENPSTMKQIIAEMTGTEWRLSGQSQATVGGVPAVRVEVDGAGGDYANDHGVYYMMSRGSRGWLIFCITSKANARKTMPLMEAAVRSVTVSK